MSTDSTTKLARDAGLAQRALDLPRLTLEDLVGTVGVSRWSLAKYREGKVEMPRRVRLRLAAFLEAHARQVQLVAEELTASVDGGDT